MGFLSVVDVCHTELMGLFVMLFFFVVAAALAVATCNAELSDALGNEEIRSTQDLSNYFLKEAGYRVGTCLGPLIGAAFGGDSLAPFFITALGCIAFLPGFFMSKEASQRSKKDKGGLM